MGEKPHNAMFRRKEWLQTVLIDAAPSSALRSFAKEAIFGVASEAGASRQGGAIGRRT